MSAASQVELSPSREERMRKRLSRHYVIVSEQRIEAMGRKRGHPLYRIARSVEQNFLPHYFAAPPKWRLWARQIGREKRCLPDFCIIGPIKAGTSDLAVSLMLHPNVMPPLAKEFWTADTEQWRLYYPTEREKARRTAEVGVALAPYVMPALYEMETAYNLAQVRPDAKIVIILREPGERLYSHWKWEVLIAGQHRAERLPFLSTFASYVNTSIDTFCNAPMFTACGARGLDMSIYWKAVKYWIDLFGRGNVLVLDVGEYFRDRGPFLERVESFIGLPLCRTDGVAAKVNENPIRLPPPDPDTMVRLREFFTPYNERLWGLIGREFPW